MFTRKSQGVIVLPRLRQHAQDDQPIDQQHGQEKSEGCRFCSWSHHNDTLDRNTRGSYRKNPEC